MSGIFVRGMGTVSPAGWGVQPLVEALKKGEAIPAQTLPGPKKGDLVAVKRVPVPGARLSFGTHPRLRRTSAISQFVVAAALEALQPWQPLAERGVRLGIVMGTHTACVCYSERFYSEVLHDPSTASPMLFPETVINAPASHLAALLGGTPRTYTVVGDQSAFLQALLVATEWLLEQRLDVCLVVSAEEAAWPVADALRRFAQNAILSEGAGAVVLAREPGDATGIALERVTNAHCYAGEPTRHAAARAMRGEFPHGNQAELLVDARCGVSRLDLAETTAWQGWPGARLSPRVVLGEGLSAATAWQFVAACEALEAGRAEAANVSVVGGNQQAIGARLVRTRGRVSRSADRG